jgi:hypothetical protein
MKYQDVMQYKYTSTFRVWLVQEIQATQAKNTRSIVDVDIFWFWFDLHAIVPRIII